MLVEEPLPIEPLVLGEVVLGEAGLGADGLDELLEPEPVLLPMPDDVPPEAPLLDPDLSK